MYIFVDLKQCIVLARDHDEPLLPVGKSHPYPPESALEAFAAVMLGFVWFEAVFAL